MAKIKTPRSNVRTTTTPVQAMWLKSMATLAWDKMYEQMKAADLAHGGLRRWHETYTLTELNNAGFWYGAAVAFELKFGREMTGEEHDLMKYVFLTKEHEVKVAVGKDAMGFYYYETSKPKQLLKLEKKFAKSSA